MVEPNKPPKRFVTAAEAIVDHLPWGPHYWLCHPGLVEAKNLLLVRVEMPPGQGHAFHRHDEMEEIIYVVSGRAEQWVDRERRVLAPGEIAHIPIGVVHATYNPFDEPMVFLAILSPNRLDGPPPADVSREEPWRSLRTAE